MFMGNRRYVEYVDILSLKVRFYIFYSQKVPQEKKFYLYAFLCTSYVFAYRRCSLVNKGV